MAIEDTLNEFQDEIDRVDDELQALTERFESLCETMNGSYDDQDLKSRQQEVIRRGIEVLCSVMRIEDKVGSNNCYEAKIKLGEFIKALKL